MNVQDVRRAIEKTGSIRAAAQSLGVAHTTLTLWLASNGFSVKKTARLVKRRAVK